MNSSRQRGLAAPYALVTGFAALFALGTVAAALHGRFSPTAMLIAATDAKRRRPRAAQRLR